MPRSYRLYFRLTVLLLSAAAMLAATAYYLVCLVAIHVSVCLGRVSGQKGVRLDAAADGLSVGVASVVAWTLLFGALASAFAGNYTVLPYALVLALPAGVVIGWQVGGWQQAMSWARSPGSLILGEWSKGPFFVGRPYTVTLGERLRHVVCSGATGSGKSTLLRNLILQDLRRGNGVCVIDPKDDLIDGLLPHLPRARLDDVILFDITDRERPLGLNPLAGVPEGQRSLAASELLSVFRRYFADAWGARLEHVLRNVILALLEVPDATMLDVPRLLLDRNFCERVVQRLSNPAVREFFLYEYEEVLRRRGDAVEPILNKVGPWLSYPELRQIIGQPQSSFEPRRVIDEGKVLLVRIPQGAFGEDISNLLGALIVAKLQLAAQSRVDLPPERRRPFFLYVDEFQNFATSSFSKILTEARAFGLGVVAANQYPEQLSRELQQAMQHNAATFVEAVQRRGSYQLAVVRQEDLAEKKPPVYHLRPAGPLGPGDPTWAAEVRRVSRQRYGRAFETVDEPPAGVTTTGDRGLAPAGRRDIEEE